MQRLTLCLQGSKFSDPMKTKIFNATKSYLEGTFSDGKDAYSNSMRYYKDKGVGGKPLIISAGPDGDYGTATGSEKKRTDNIRSDTRE
jgi:hypothetical protein